MGLEPDARLVVKRDVDLRKLPLTPTDFFLFSRVESLSSVEAPTVADVIAASGQPAESAGQALERLVELGVITTKKAPGAGPKGRARVPTPRGSSSEMRERARRRRRGLLEAQMRSVRGASAGKDPEPAANSREPKPRPELVTDDEASLPTPREHQAQAEPAPGPRSILDEVEPVAETDPRLQHDATVDLDRQRRLLALRDRLRHISHFELLGLDPVDDLKAIRRAYHVVSREFHPDSFYGQNLGDFQGVLDDLFRRARASYEVLLDDDRRRPLVEIHEVRVRAERERREREQVEADAKAEAQAEQARVRAEAEAAQNKQKEQEARMARDRVRQQRIRERALEQRRRQAKKNADQARGEQENGRHGAAATLFRLAHEHDPSNTEYEQLWRESLAISRRQRAESSYDQGRAARKAGRLHEAARCLALAADAEPSLRNLTEAATVMSEVNAERGHELAMAALEALQQAKARGSQPDNQTMASVHQACAKAFLAVGQHASAKEQAERAHQIAPSKQTQTLLNSLKLT